MADDYTTLNPGTGGDTMDEEAITYPDAPTSRKRSRIVIAGDDTNKLASVSRHPPEGSHHGLAVQVRHVELLELIYKELRALRTGMELVLSVEIRELEEHR